MQRDWSVLPMPRLVWWLVLMFSLLAGPLDARELHVDPSHALAADSSSGEVGKPFRTIGAAVRQMMPGDRLVIHRGVYREAILIPERNWVAAPETIIEGAAGEDVLILGSDVLKDWRSLGDGLFVRVMQQEPQQVFIDGKPLTQVGGTIFGGYPGSSGHSLAGLHAEQGGIWTGRIAGDQKTLPDGSFFFSHDTKALYVKTAAKTLAEATVEVSVRPYLVFGKNVANLTLRRLAFMHASTSTVSRSAAVTLIGSRLKVENLRISHVDSVGIEISGSDVLIRNTSANYCGQLGMKARGKNFRLIDNETSWNNTRGFNKWWEAGGAKFVGQGGLQGSTITGHSAIGNNGDGIWFDWKNSENTIGKSVVSFNKGFGIHYEASDRATIVDNFVFANAQRGIYLPHSSDSVIAHNAIFSNGLEGVAIIDENRKDPQGSYDLRPRNNKVFGNIVAWNGGAVVLPKDVNGNWSDANYFVGNTDQVSFSLGWPRLGRRSMSDIDAWRRSAGMDLRSVVSSRPESAELGQQIRKRDQTAYRYWAGVSGADALPSVLYSVDGFATGKVRVGPR